MDRRALYKLVAEILPKVGGAGPLLDAVAEAMHSTRKSPAAPQKYLADLQPILNQDDALGQVYQAINAPALEAAFRGTARTGRKFTPGEIPAVTQLFTPKWVVEFLLQNTLGRLWLEIHPDSQLCHGRLPHAVVPRTNGTPVVSAIDLRICDPACGTMNFGLVAFDMLRQMYLEELARAGQPGWPKKPPCNAAEIGATIVRHNLFGFDIDPMAIELARRSLEIKIGQPIPDGNHHLSLRDALFDDSPAGSFDIVVTNPPYLSARNLDPAVVRRLKSKYPSSWRDLYASFMIRSLQMLRPGGRLGILSMHSFMFTSAFERMRRELQELSNLQIVAHFGPGLFDIGNPGTLQTAAIVSQRRPAPQNPAVFYRLVNEDDKHAALNNAVAGQGSANSIRFEMTAQQLSSLPRLAWMYWISSAARRAFTKFQKLGDISPPRQGLATTDNMRFVRYWWEVEPPAFSGPRDKWMPYAKGGRFRRWYESPRHRVNWQDDGREIKAAIVDRYPYLDGQWQWVAKNSAWYGRKGITYSYLTSGSFSARRLEEGTIFDVAGSSLFPDDSLAMLGILNSSAAGELLSAINPTVNFQVGDLRQLPVPKSFPNELRIEVQHAIDLTKNLDCFDETSMDFSQPEPWNGDGIRADDLRASLARAEQLVDQIVGELYAMPATNSPTRQGAEQKPEIARRWISYALGVWLGRWGGSAKGEIAMLSPLDETLRQDLWQILTDRAGEESAIEIEAAVGGLEHFLASQFLPWHNRIYRGRPVIWGFAGNGKTVAVSSLTADARVMRAAFGRIGQSLPAAWERFPDDGIAINLAPLAQSISDRKLRVSLEELAVELRQGRYSFSRTSKWMKESLIRGSSAESVPVPRPKRRVAASVPAAR